MFRQDRTNPSTAVSTWNGRRDLAKANPSTAVSAWMNGGLAGGSSEAITAYGGKVSQYTDSGTTYRVHWFQGNGTFEVITGAGDVTYLIVGGGGGGGGPTSNAVGGGGGAGSIETGTVAVTASTNYTM